MGHYGDLYQASADSSVIKAHLPEAYKKMDLPHSVKVALAEGYQARKELNKVRQAITVLRGLDARY